MTSRNCILLWAGHEGLDSKLLLSESSHCSGLWSDWEGGTG